MRRANPAEPASWDVGILTAGSGDGEILVMLLDLPAFGWLVEHAGAGELEQALADPHKYVLGYLTMIDRVPYLQEHPKGGQDAWACGATLEVTAAAAQRGWGPLLHDVALAVAKEANRDGVIPDRRSNTAAEARVWLHYRTKRADVESAELPPGCPRLGPPYLNRAYRAGEGFPDRLLRQLRDNTRHELEDAAEAAQGPGALEIATYVESAGQSLFLELFEAEVRRSPLGGAVANPRRRPKRGATDLRALKRRLMR